MSKRISATEARIHLGVHLDHIDNNDVIIVEHDGAPEAVMIPSVEYQRLWEEENQYEDWWDLAERSRDAFRHQLSGRKVPSAVEIIREGGNEQRAEPHFIQPVQGDWKEAFANVRARIRDEVGDKPLDIDEIIHRMREERVAELLDGLR